MSHRAQVTLTDEQYARLCDEARRSGLSFAELVRRAIDRSYGEAPSGDLKEALAESFGAWKDRDFDGEQYVDCLRRGVARRLGQVATRGRRQSPPKYL